MRIKIGKRLIGGGKSCFIIAEAGVNHNGDIRLAKKLIDVAKESGADAVKFQTFITEKIVTKNASKANYQKIITGTKESQYQMLKKLELAQNDFLKLKKYADSENILFFSTPYDEESVEFLYKTRIPAFKISSADITNYPLLTTVAKKKLPIILSTGMSTLGEVKEAVNLIKETGNKKLILLHCNFNYPAKIEEVNLLAMKTLSQTFQVPVGYSDHTEGIEIPIAAVSLGACVIEKHFTLNKNLPGPDHKASLEPKELREMINKIRNIEKALGSPIKFPTKSERLNRRISRRSIVAAQNLSRGMIITPDKILVKRPGTGIPPKRIKNVIGRRVIKDIKLDELITWNKIR